MTPTWVDIANFVVASIALILGVVLHFRDRRHSEDLLALQQEMNRIEKARRSDEVLERSSADLRASVLRVGRAGRSLILLIKNHGVAPAADVRVLIDGVPASESEILEHDTESAARRTFGPIGPGNSLSLPILAHAAAPNEFVVAVRWKNRSGTDGSTETQVRIPW